MNREETLALYEQGVEAWNKWANEMLEEKKRLEESGEWAAENILFGWLRPKNEKTHNWLEKAEADFSSRQLPSTFEKEVDFSNFIFPGETSFYKMTFIREARFDGTTFKLAAWFKKASFKEQASFDTAKFNGIAWFEGTSFNKSTTFDTTTFKGEAGFYYAKFVESAQFNTATFNGIAWFEGTTFNKSAAFVSTTFKREASFNTATFKEAWFNKAKFKEKVSFKKATFNGREALFDIATFNREASFEGATFNGIASFDIATFNGKEALFSTTTFNESATFVGTTFNRMTSFHNATFNREAFFNSTIFKGYTSFQAVSFEKKANFNAISSDSAFTLKNTSFKNQVPDFIQANFKEAPRLDNIQIEDNVPPGSFKNSTTTFIHPDIKASYQALKRLAIQAHDHENEQRFWAGELRSDRSLRTKDGGWNHRPLYSAFWWGNIAYGCVSDYGRSIVRPIGALLILICLMTGLHLTKSKTPLTYDKAFSAGYIAANKSFLYLGTDPTKRSIIKEKYSALYGANENQTPKIPKTILTAEFFQTLLSAIFIFLALLGIRNNFKMK